MTFESHKLIATKADGVIAIDSMNLVEVAIEMNERTNTLIEILEAHQEFILNLQERVLELENQIERITNG